MKRVPEPELMEGREQARAYARADFEEPHSRFLSLLQDTFPAGNVGPWVADLGCGTADIGIRVARAYRTVESTASTPPGPCSTTAGKPSGRPAWRTGYTSIRDTCRESPSPAPSTTPSSATACSTICPTR